MELTEMKGACVPMYINGCAFVLRDVVSLRIQYGGINELLVLSPDGWKYRNGRAAAVSIGDEEMDLILINWSDTFDHFSSGFCSIKVLMSGGNTIEYRN